MKQTDNETIFASKQGLQTFMIQTSYNMRFDPSWRGIRDQLIQMSYPYNYIPREGEADETGSTVCPREH